MRGTRVRDHWLDLHQLSGPFNLAADDTWLYFDWQLGAGPNPPLEVARARINGTDVHLRYLNGQGPFLLTP